MSRALSTALCVARPSSGLNPNVPVLATSSSSDDTEIKVTDLDVPHNHVLVRVDRFGFSANNVTYQALGEAPHFRYFEFHAPPEDKAGGVSYKTHGLVPVWGFGTVVRSAHARVSAGERVYGYFAPAHYLLVPVSPSDVTRYAFYVPRPHLPADRRPYNQILRCASDPMYDPSGRAEDLTMLYRPLFWTSFWCEDWLNESGYRAGCTRLLISSASAKTAFCLAYLVRGRHSASASGGSGKVGVIGLTSPRNLAFTRGLGLYDDVLAYDELERAPQVDAEARTAHRWIYVDVAGNDALNARIFHHFKSKPLAAAIQLGLSSLSPGQDGKVAHGWRQENTQLAMHGAPATSSDGQLGPAASPSPSTGTARSTPKPKLEEFFMVEWLAIRRRQLSPPDIISMQIAAWKALMRDCVGWVKIERVCGAERVKACYEEVARSGVGAEKGLVWSMWDAQEGDGDGDGEKAKL